MSVAVLKQKMSVFREKVETRINTFNTLHNHATVLEGDISSKTNEIYRLNNEFYSTDDPNTQQQIAQQIHALSASLNQDQTMLNAVYNEATQLKEKLVDLREFIKGFVAELGQKIDAYRESSGIFAQGQSLEFGASFAADMYMKSMEQITEATAIKEDAESLIREIDTALGESGAVLQKTLGRSR